VYSPKKTRRTIHHARSSWWITHGDSPEYAKLPMPCIGTFAPDIQQRTQRASTCRLTRDKKQKCATTHAELVSHLERNLSAASSPEPSGSSQPRLVSRRHYSASANNRRKSESNYQAVFRRKYPFYQINESHSRTFNFGLIGTDLRDVILPVSCSLTSSRPAGQRNIRHLFRKHSIAFSTWPQRRPIPGLRQQWFMQLNNLLLQNPHSALQVVLRLQNCLSRIISLQCPVVLPVEVAPIPLLVFVRQLQQPSLRAARPVTPSFTAISGSVCRTRVVGFSPASAPASA
jgi:hypothetical protein